MPRLSIVIPVWGNLKQLEDTLVSVLQNRPEDSEVLVVLDEPYDDPYDLKDEVRFLRAAAGSGLAALMNAGVTASRAAICHLLMCGTAVEEGWADAALAHFGEAEVAVVAPLVLNAVRPERLLSAGLAYRAGGRLAMLGRGRPVESAPRLGRSVQAAPLTAGFYRKSALAEAGLFAKTVGHWLVSLDMALSLGEAGYRTVLEPECRVLASPASGVSAGAFRQALDLERLYWRWAPQRARFRSLAAHAWTVVGETLASIPRLTIAAQMTGRLVGAWSGGPRRNGTSPPAQERRQPTETPPGPHFRSEAARSSIAR